MSVRVGIMGFGRIGRNVFRIITASHPDIEVVAIVDVADPKTLEYLLRFDTVHGAFTEPFSVKSDAMYVRGRQIKMITKKEPGEVDWKALGVDIVIEATGKYRHRAQLEKHLAMGAKKVILTVPPRDEIDAVIVTGVNDHILTSRTRSSPRDPARRMPRADRPGPERRVRDREGVHDDGSRLHERPAAGRRPARGPAAQPGGGREHHPDDDLVAAGGRADPAGTRGQARTGSRSTYRCRTARRSTS